MIQVTKWLRERDLAWLTKEEEKWKKDNFKVRIVVEKNKISTFRGKRITGYSLFRE